jgi:hypothetical protein
VRNYTADLHRFLELLPNAAAHTTEPVTGAHVDEVLLAYANTTDHRRTPAPGETVQDPRWRMAATAAKAKAAGSTLRMRRSLSGFFTWCVDQAWATVFLSPPEPITSWLPTPDTARGRSTERTQASPADRRHRAATSALATHPKARELPLEKHPSGLFE